jgi:hypothetical protein
MKQTNLHHLRGADRSNLKMPYIKIVFFLMSILLFSLTSIAQTFVQITNTAGTVAYSGINVTVAASGGTTYASTCTPAPHFQTFTTGSSWTFTFSSPVSMVRIPYINSSGGTTTTAQFIVNGSPYTLTGANITGNDNQCGDATVNPIVGGNLTNTGDESGFPNSQVDIPGPITSITVLQTTGSNTNAFQMEIATCPPGSPMPAIVLVTGGGGYCLGGAGVNVGIAGAAVGINYQLYRGGAPVGAPVAGPGYGFSFGLQTIPGVYTVTGTNSSTGCTSNMWGSATVSTYSLPNVYGITGGGEYCPGGIGVPIGLSTSDVGVNYQLYRAGSPVLFTTTAGTGGPINFGNQTAAGLYTAVATSTSTGCQNTMAGATTVIIDPLPLVYTITGGGNYCSGGAGVHIGLSNSTIGVNYQLYLGAVAVGSPVAGIGGAIDFGLFTAIGPYTARATDASTGCVNSMSGTVVVGIFAAPVAATVTGGGGYCPGGAGVNVGLSGSVSGTNYQLYLAGSPVGSPVAGTGSAISFGLQTATGAYTVVATSTFTGCSANMTGVANVYIIGSLTAYTVTGGGSYCSGGSGLHVGIAGSSTGVNYQLYRGGTPVSGVIAGTGVAIDFGLQTIAGTYTVMATVAGAACTAAMTGSVAINVNPLPNVYTVTGGGNYCAGGTGVHIFLGNSDIGVNYQLYKGTVPVGAPMAGISGALDFGLQTVGGTYTVVASDATTACTRNMSGSAIVSPIALPTIYSVTGGGSYCTGGAGVHIYLSGSQTGINYQLYNGASAVGSPIGGTGTTLNFGTFSTAGTYTVVATNAPVGCSNNMTGSATITVNSVPNAYTVTGGGAYCSGTTGIAVGLGSSDAGVSYRLYRGGSAVGSAVAGTGIAISFGLQTIAGIYTVIATNSSTGCTSTMTGSVAVSVGSSPASVSVTGGGGYCAGGAGLHVGLAGSASGVNYQLYRAGSPVGGPVAGGSGAIDFGLQTTAGTYTVIGTLGTSSCSTAMSGSATITVYSVPSVYSVTGGGSYCGGFYGVHIGLSGSNTGVSYKIYRSGLLAGTVSGTGAVIDFGLFTTAGTYTVIAYAAVTGCATTMSGSAVVSINPLPTVTGSAYTVAPAPPGPTSITLTGSISGGTWSSSNTSIATVGASTGVVSGISLGTSIISYTLPTGCVGSHIVYVTPTGHKESPIEPATVSTKSNDISVTPNPNKGTFTVRGSLQTDKDAEVILEITDMLGKTVYTNRIITNKGDIDETIQLSNVANGMYLLSLRSENMRQVFHVVVEH